HKPTLPMCRHAHGSTVRVSVPFVSPDALHDLQEHTRAEHLGKEVQVLAAFVTVVENGVLAQRREALGCERQSGVKDVGVAVWYRQYRNGAGLHMGGGGDRVVRCEGDVLRIRDRWRPVAPTQRCGVERDPYPMRFIHGSTAADEAERSRQLDRILRLKAK